MHNVIGWLVPFNNWLLCATFVNKHALENNHYSNIYRQIQRSLIFLHNLIIKVKQGSANNLK